MKVLISETIYLSKVIEVNTTNEQEAIDKVIDMVVSGEVELNSNDDFVDSDSTFFVVGDDKWA